MINTDYILFAIKELLIQQNKKDWDYELIKWFSCRLKDGVLYFHSYNDNKSFLNVKKTKTTIIFEIVQEKFKYEALSEFKSSISAMHIHLNNWNFETKVI